MKPAKGFYTAPRKRAKAAGSKSAKTRGKGHERSGGKRLKPEGGTVPGAMRAGKSSGGGQSIGG